MRKFLIVVVALLVLGGIFYLVSGFFKREGGASGPGKPLTLSYYTYGEQSKILAGLISQYQKKHPNVKVSLKEFQNVDAYEDQLVNEMAEGRGPDIFSMPNHWSYKHIRKITPAPVSAMSGEDFRKTFVDTADRDLIRPDQNGVLRIFGVPLFVDTLAIYYNKDHFEDRLAAKGRPSETWTDFMSDVFQLTKVENGLMRVAGAALGRTDNISLGLDVLYAMMLQKNTKFYDKGNTIATFATSQRMSDGKTGTPGVDALVLFTSFAQYSQKNYSWSREMPDAISAFAQGKVSMIFGYSSTYQEILNAIATYSGQKQTVIEKASVRVAPFPQFFDADTATQKRVTLARYSAETVSRNSKYAAEAWDLLLFLTNKENAAAYFQATHRPTARRDLIEEQKKDPFYGVFATQSAFGVSMPLYDEQKSAQIFGPAAYKVVDENQTASSALKEAEDRFNGYGILPDEGFLGPGPYVATPKK